MLEQYIAAFSRNLSFIPGGYYISIFLKSLFKNKDNGEKEWREFSFRDIRFKVNLSSYMGNLIYWRGAHEWAPVYAILNNVKKGFTVLDIGANQGEITLWSAKATGENGKVISFEPLTQMFKQLQENLSLNPAFKKYVYPVQIGLSDRHAKLPIYGASASDIHGGVHEGMPTLYKTENRNVLIEEITISTLDDELEKLNIDKVDFIKIDVEGSELPILKGGIKILSKCKPILLIESNEETFVAAGYSQKEFFAFLNQFGYKYYLVGVRGGLKQITVNEMPEFCNILARI